MTVAGKEVMSKSEFVTFSSRKKKLEKLTNWQVQHFQNLKITYRLCPINTRVIGSLNYHATLKAIKDTMFATIALVDVASVDDEQEKEYSLAEALAIVQYLELHNMLVQSVIAGNKQIMVIGRENY